MVTILGIDPGTTSIGYAIIKYSQKKPQLLHADLFHTKPINYIDNLKQVNYILENILNQWKPDILAIEKLYFAKNTKTALSVAETRGAILLITSLAGLEVYEYTPLEVKKVITGDGRADKTQIKKMLNLTLPETCGLKAQDDVYDAIAIALTHCYQRKVELFQ